MPRKASALVIDEPLNTYGIKSVNPELVRQRLGKNAQLFYWQRAFAEHPYCVNFGAPPREVLFRKISDVLVPGYFSWHPWTERMINALCNNQWVGIAGCAGCVAGGTRVLNPLSGDEPTIEFLTANRIAPVVMTLDGPKQADIPFVKGQEELFEVRLSDGSSFCATAEHRLLTPQGFVALGSLSPGQRLFSYAPTHQASNVEHDLSTRAQGAPGSRKTRRGYQDRYSPDLRLCGEQLRNAQEAYRFSVQERSDAPTRNRASYSSDGSAYAISRNPFWSQSGHPSTPGFLSHRNSWDIPSERLLGPETIEHAANWCESLSQSRSMTHFLAPSGESIPRFATRRLAVHNESSRYRETFEACRVLRESLPRFVLASDVQRSVPICDPEEQYTDLESEPIDLSRDLMAYRYTVSQSRIVSIRTTGRHVYYDISVPGPQHYFAEGAIHHNSSKTHNLTGFAVVWWLCAPKESSVIFTSTTSKALRKRNWQNVQSLHSLIPGMPIGNFVDSRLVWQVSKGDDLHAIMGVAVEEGDAKASADKIKGTHTKRQMVIINEANSVNPGIFEACANLYSYPEQAGGEFILAMEANPSSWLDQFGRFTEPDKGVKSVNVDTHEEWETVPKTQYNGKKGICIRFDVEKTPNLDYPEDKPICKHIPSRARVERCKNSVSKDSPTYWSNERGFPPPEGLNKNVFSEVSLDRWDAYGQHRFAGRGVQIIAGFDTARNGDKPTLRFAAMGELENGDMAIEVMKPIPIKVNVNSNNPIVYQLLEQVRRECENVTWRGQKTSCPPENLGIDATGGGADQCDVFQRMWSFGIMRIGFGEAASEDACNHEDVRPCNEVYRNLRAQMYFRTRDSFSTGQLKGLDKETAREMSTILFDDSKALIVIENKDDYRLRHKKSPDDTDSLVILSEVARRKGFKLAVQGQTMKKYEQHEKVVEKAQQVFETVSYSADNEDLTMSFEFAGAEEE